jgi:hypothetical protein
VRLLGGELSAAAPTVTTMTAKPSPWPPQPHRTVTTLRPPEEWARQLIERTLGMTVRQHDDGSKPGMYDLDIISENTVIGAVEVTAAVEAEATAYWRAADHGEPWSDARIAGAWTVHTSPRASVRELRRRLPDLLVKFQDAGIQSYDAPEEWDRRPPDTDAAALGVTSALHGPTDFPGRIYLMPPSDSKPIATFAAETGNPLIDWAVGWLRQPSQADNLRKLDAAAPAQRHLFLILPPLTVAPDEAVMVLLSGSDRPALPNEPPTLPAPITHLWIASGWNVPFGIRWDPDCGWSLFSAGTVRG